MFPTTATPWGASHDAKTIAEGIVFHSTSSHGGYQLSEERLAAMPSALAAIPPFAGTGWYEEDCDWAIVALAFPERFTAFELWSAVRTVRGGSACLQLACDYVDSNAGAALRTIVEAFVADNGHRYTVCAMSSGGTGDGWLVSFARISDGARATVRGLATAEACAGVAHDLSTDRDRVQYLDGQAGTDGGCDAR